MQKRFIDTGRGTGKGQGGACRILAFEVPRRPERDNLDLTADLIDYRLDSFTPVLLEQYRKKIARRGLFECGNMAEYARVETWQRVLRDSLSEIGRILDAYRAGAMNAAGGVPCKK